MLRFLHIEYMDGEKEVHAVHDGFDAVRVKDGHLLVSGGDGSYMRRGERRGFPMGNVRRWWLKDTDEG